ncbi:SNAP25 likeous protein SNAP33 [Apostasia shenzhenica]|uniref:SNAP25 likeous protein SNAP33 n=1 Tax=Apostasia shenzhenica TaxID=1088818 RepID=A0A2I0AW56_9ASPA|nr:SNAP25 likeous protein SNAP33 [Apostasia shenzhenica]
MWTMEQLKAGIFNKLFRSFRWRSSSWFLGLSHGMMLEAGHLIFYELFVKLLQLQLELQHLPIKTCFVTIMYRFNALRTPSNSEHKPAEYGFLSNKPFNFDSKPNQNPGATGLSSIKSHHSNYNGYGGGKTSSSPSSSILYCRLVARRNMHNTDQLEPGGCENQSLQELEKYSINKAEESTQKINRCLKVAEEIREDASKTLVNLHQQGEQIRRTHSTAASIEDDLSRGEKILGSLGGLFSKPWKPKKTREIKGPLLDRDDSLVRRANHMEQRQKLGLNPRRSFSNPRKVHAKSSFGLERVELEKAKQEDALSDLGNLLGQLKAMAVDMGSEIERQNRALVHMQDDVDELNYRVKGANRRARCLLGR